MVENNPVLEIRNLEKYFSPTTNLIQSLLTSESEQIQAVDDVSIGLRENEVQGVIGESGCGKTTLLKTIAGLYDPTDGDVYYRGDPVSEFSRTEMKEFRSEVQVIFQDPFNTFDPKMKVRESLMEPLRIHSLDDKETRMKGALRNAELKPENYLDRFPQELSGGEKQRVSIARALILEPDVLLADEPVSMLDVSTQASVLNLLSELKDELGLSILYISHDLSTVSYLCDLINVMYLGRIIERAPTKQLLTESKHPYTQALVNAIPIPDPHTNRERTVLKGSVPDPVGIGKGCRFRDRCPEAMEVCEQTPFLIEDERDHNVACHLFYDHDSFMEAEDLSEANHEPISQDRLPTADPARDEPSQSEVN
jgi:peptide/nickel transport system ATP-binding protein